jgi:uncharacterized protein YecT (DUF1311 family)
MLRLTAVFLIWIASTAHALEDRCAEPEVELHQAYLLAWSEADDEQRELLVKAQRGWNLYRAANCALIGDECHALMAQDRAAELRYLVDSLTETNGRTISSTHDREERDGAGSKDSSKQQQ